MNEEEARKALNIAIGKTQGVHVYQNTLREAIETVLNLLEKKNAEYSDLKLKYEQNLRMCKHFREELNRKDKMIDLIYDFFYKFGCKFSGSFMKALSLDGFDISKCDNCEYKTCDCKECIKQYFERKVENGN